MQVKILPASLIFFLRGKETMMELNALPVRCNYCRWSEHVMVEGEDTAISISCTNPAGTPSYQPCLAYEYKRKKVKFENGLPRGRRPDLHEYIKVWILEQINEAGGSILSSVILEKAKGAGLKKSTLYKAKRSLRVSSHANNVHGKIIWYWV